MLSIHAMFTLFRSVVLWKGMPSATLEGWAQDRLHQEQIMRTRRCSHTSNVRCVKSVAFVDEGQIQRGQLLLEVARGYIQ